MNFLDEDYSSTVVTFPNIIKDMWNVYAYVVYTYIISIY